MFLFKRHTAGGYTGNFLEFCLALGISAPHSFDEAGLFGGSLNHLLKIQSGEGAVLAILKCALVQTVVDSLQQLGYLAFQLVQRNKGLFTVVAADNDALVLFDVL